MPDLDTYADDLTICPVHGECLPCEGCAEAAQAAIDSEFDRMAILLETVECSGITELGMIALDMDIEPF